MLLSHPGQRGNLAPSTIDRIVGSSKIFFQWIMFNYFADNEDVKHNEFYEILLETENGEVLNDYLL